MASLLNWLGKELNQAKNAVGGAVHGAENQVSNAVHQAPQAIQRAVQNPGVQQAAQQIGQRAMPPGVPILPAISMLQRPITNMVQHPLQAPQAAYNFVKPTVDQAIGLGKTGVDSATGVPQAVGHLGAAGIEALAGQGQAARYNLDQANQIANNSQFHQRFLSQQDRAIAEAHPKNRAELAKALTKGVRQGVSQAVMDASLFYTPGQTTGAVKSAPTLAKAVGPAVLRSIPAGVVQGTALTGTQDNPTLKDLATNVGTAVAMNATLAGGGAAVGYGLKKTPEINNHLNTINDGSTPQALKASQGAAAGGQGHVPLPDTPQWAKAVKNSAEGATPEISDAGMKVKSSGVSQLQAGKPVYLSDLIKHKELNKSAGFLMDTKDPRALKVVPKDNIPKAFVDKPNGVIYMPSGYVKNLDSELGRKTLMEEVQHSIDFHAGRDSGTTPATEQLNAAPQQLQDAVRQSSALKPRVDELNKLVTKGNMTAEEVAKHPDTIAYQKALEVRKSLAGQAPSAEEATALYRNNPGERIGSAVGDRSGLTQQQLRDNPMGLPLVEQRGATPAFAMSEKGGPKVNEPDELAKALGLDHTPTRNSEIKELGLPTQKKSVNPELAAMLKEQRNAPNPINLPKVQEGDAKQAVLNSKFAGDSIVDRGAQVIKAGKKLSKNDLALLDQLRTKSPEQLAKQAENPQAFLKAANAAKGFTDYNYSLGQGSGQTFAYRKNYGAAALYDLSDEHTFNELQKLGAVPSGASLKDAAKAGYANERKVPNYDVGEKLGLKRLNSNFLEDIAYDAKRRANDISELQLAKGLTEAYPGQVSIGEIPRGFEQLRIKGGQPISMPRDIARELNKRAYSGDPGKVVGAYDAVNSGLKYTQLGGGTFHAAATTGSVGGQQVVDAAMHPTSIPGKIADNARLVAGTLSRKVHDRNMAAFAEDAANNADGVSTLDRARLAGATLRPDEILGDANISLIDKAKDSRFNFIKNAHDMVFQRQIPEAKLMIFKQKTKGLDVNNPADLAKMREAASAVNNLGGINRAIEGMTPAQARRVGRAVLATDYTETKFRKLSDALSKRPGNPQGDIARQMVIGKALVMAAPGLAVAAAAGQLNTPEDWAKEIGKQILDPQIQTPFESKSGIAKVAKLPSTEISELGRIFLPMFDHSDGSTDPLSGAKHYATARSSAALSAGISLATNQDYFGDPIVKKNDDGSVNVGKTIGTLAASKAPIPIAQGIKTKQGLQGVPEAIINTLGARITNDPNDPHSRSFAFKNNTVNGLPDNIKNDAKRVFGLNQKDANGNKVTVVPALHTQENALTMLQHPELIDVGQKLNDKNEELGLPSDPFYKLDRTQQQMILNIQADKFRNPAEKKALTSAASSWLPQYYDDRSKFFDSLNLPPSTKTQELAGPTVSPHVQGLFNIQDPTARAKALGSDPEAQAYFKANDLYVNQGRAKQGLPAMIAHPQASTYVQQQLDAKNFRDPQVQAYLNQNNAFNIVNGASQDQYQGTSLGSSTLKSIKNLGSYGIVQNPDGTLAIAGSPQQQGGATSTHFASGGKKGGRKGIGSRGGKSKVSTAGLNKLLRNTTIKTPKAPKFAKAKVSKAPHLKMATIKKKPSLA